MESRFTLAHNWFSKADKDLKNAELIFMADSVEKPYDTVCFHCQQVAEKYLKGFLLYLGITFPKTHNIEVLMDLVSQNYPEMNEYFQAVALTYYAVENRHPDDFVEIQEDEAKEAYRFAKEVKSFVMKHLGTL